MLSNSTTEFEALPATWINTSPAIPTAIGASMPMMSGSRKPISFALNRAAPTNIKDSMTPNPSASNVAPVMNEMTVVAKIVVMRNISVMTG